MKVTHLDNNETELQLELWELHVITRAVADWYFRGGSDPSVEDAIDPPERMFCNEIIALGSKALKADREPNDLTKG